MVAVLATGASSALALGVRHNNPMNIKYNKANHWLGAVGTYGDGLGNTFVEFSDSKYSYRAAVHILRSYQGRGLMTVRQMINTWAVPDGRDVAQNYAESVASAAGVSPDEPVNLSVRPDVMQAMITRMSKVEVGSVATLANAGAITDGVNIA